MAPKKRPAANAAAKRCYSSEPVPAAAKHRREEISIPGTPMSSAPVAPHSFGGGSIDLPLIFGEVADLKVKVGVAESRAEMAEKLLEKVCERLAEAEKRIVSADMRAVRAEDQAASLQKIVDRQYKEIDGLAKDKECLQQQAMSESMRAARAEDQAASLQKTVDRQYKEIDGLAKDKESLQQQAMTESRKAAYFEGKLKVMSGFPELVKLTSESFLKVILQSQGAKPVMTVKPEIFGREDSCFDVRSSHAQASGTSGRLVLPVSTGAVEVATGAPAGLSQQETPENCLGRPSLGSLSAPVTHGSFSGGHKSIGGLSVPGTPGGSTTGTSKDKEE